MYSLCDISYICVWYIYIYVYTLRGIFDICVIYTSYVCIYTHLYILCKHIYTHIYTWQAIIQISRLGKADCEDAYANPLLNQGMLKCWWEMKPNMSLGTKMLQNPCTASFRNIYHGTCENPLYGWIWQCFTQKYIYFFMPLPWTFKCLPLHRYKGISKTWKYLNDEGPACLMEPITLFPDQANATGELQSHARVTSPFCLCLRRP